MYLFDTDVISNLIAGRPSPRLLKRLEKVAPEEQFTSAITVGELVYGAYKSGRPEVYLQRYRERVWPYVRVVAFGKEAANVYGKLRSELEATGTPLSEPDLRIASIVLSRGMVLVTGNVKHFARIKELKIENWL